MQRTRKTREGLPRVGFVGTGVMGGSMARHLLAAGYGLRVHNRTPAKAQPLLELGAQWCDTPGDTVEGCEFVVTIVGYPRDVEQVYLAPDGLVARAAPGAVLIDMTTSSPALAVTIHEHARGRGVATLDAPVSGGDVGAREARLSIMVGGPRDAFERARPLFERMGTNIVYQGPAGCGQHTKLANQLAIAAGMVGVCEALAYARHAGLNPDSVLASIGSGAAGSWSLNTLGPRMLRSDYAPGFYVKHFIKDLALADESAGALGLETPGLALALKLYRRLAGEGYENDGTQALFRLFD